MGTLFNFFYITIFLIYFVNRLPSETKEVHGDFHLLFYPILYCLFKNKQTKNICFFSNLKNVKTHNF